MVYLRATVNYDEYLYENNVSVDKLSKEIEKCAALIRKRMEELEGCSKCKEE